MDEIINTELIESNRNNLLEKLSKSFLIKQYIYFFMKYVIVKPKFTLFIESEEKKMTLN